MTVNLNRFVFLNEHHSKEPFINNLLDEIYDQQQKFFNNRSDQLCTIETLRESRRIKIPISPSRNKTISYLVELLLKYYPDIVKMVLTFRFYAEPKTKNLKIIERQEITLLLTGEKYKALKAKRDQESKDNILDLFSSFRLFNLTKLLSRAYNKKYLADLIKTEIGKNLFVYKIHFLDKNNIENIDDVCFHIKNYEYVKNEINLNFLKKIVAENSSLVVMHLKKYGLINADFGDYRDSKVDYILSVMLDNMTLDLSRKNLIDIKNFKSLRNSILNADKVLDPVLSLKQDIIQHIRNNPMTTLEEIVQIYDSLDTVKLQEWIDKNRDEFNIISLDLNGAQKIFIADEYIRGLKGLSDIILYNNDSFMELSHSERMKQLESMETLCRAGELILRNKDQYGRMIQDSGFSCIEQAVKDFRDYKTRISRKDEIVRTGSSGEPGRSVVGIFIDFFKKLFSGRKKHLKDRSPSKRSGKEILSLPEETRDIYQEIVQRESKLIPLSEYIELSIENNSLVDSIINALRKNNVKIVIPIYNARKNLYPKKSQNYMIEDVEYLLVDPEGTASYESIRDFTDSLNGYMVKDETIPGVAVISIEKYLLSIYRQRRKKRL